MLIFSPHLRTRSGDPVRIDERKAPTFKPALLPAAEARAFVAYMQDWVCTGEHRWSGSGGIWNHYLWFCAHVTHRRPVAHNVFANALGEMLGDENVRRESEYQEDGRRRKLTVYVIPEAEPEMDEALPLPRLPRLTSAARVRHAERDVEPMRIAA